MIYLALVFLKFECHVFSINHSLECWKIFSRDEKRIFISRGKRELLLRTSWNEETHYSRRIIANTIVPGGNTVGSRCLTASTASKESIVPCWLSIQNRIPQQDRSPLSNGKYVPQLGPYFHCCTLVNSVKISECPFLICCLPPTWIISLPTDILCAIWKRAKVVQVADTILYWLSFLHLDSEKLIIVHQDHVIHIFLFEQTEFLVFLAYKETCWKRHIGRDRFVNIYQHRFIVCSFNFIYEWTSDLNEFVPEGLKGICVIFIVISCDED